MTSEPTLAPGLEQLLDGLPLAAVVFDSSGRTHCVNAEFVALFGGGRAELPSLEAWWQRLMSTPGADGAPRLPWPLPLATGSDDPAGYAPIAVSLSDPNGRPRQLELRAAPLDAWLMVTVLDRTEQHAAQQALAEARQAAERALREKSELIVRVSRDLHGPLKALTGQIETLAQAAGLPAAERDRLQALQSAGSRLLLSIKQLLGLGPAPAQARPAAPRRVLVAEDYEPNRVLLKRQLTRLGHAVDFARDGAEALRMWQATPYDLILTDCNMPVMDGLTMAEKIRAIERQQGGHVPIVAISANTFEQDIEHCLSAGIDAFLGKPVQLEDLKRVFGRFGLAPEPAPAAQAAAPAGTPMQHLFALLGETEPEERLRLGEIFIGSLQGLLAEAEAGLQAADARAIGPTLHKLKSSLRTIGDVSLAKQATALEAAAQAGDWSRLRQGLPELMRALAGLIDAIRAELRQAAANQGGGGAQAGPAQDWSALHVLVVDDDPFMRAQFSAMLQRLGVRHIRQAGNGAEALAELRSQPQGTEIILTDLNMPGMDGVEFIRHLVAGNYRGGIAFVSGEDSRVLSSVQELAKAQGLQVLGTLVKPVYSAALYDVLSRYGRSEVAVARPNAGPALGVVDLLEGLERNQFTAYLQPKVDARTLEVIGVEALARWEHPVHGVVSPGAFIALAEQNGLIEILTMAIFRHAIEAGSALHRQGYKLKIAVNYSAQSFGSLELPEFIVATTQAAGLDPHYLIIEVTESGLMHDPTVALDVLSRLRLKGVNLAIDDFGTGYSSIDQLRRLPFSELKIDQGFVRGADQDPMARSILESSVEMAKKLNLTTVAEGVETPEDLEVVRRLGCDLVQGYLIAKPMALNDLIAWMQRRQ
ncbi:MAG: EAL domain-containing protein [Pseudomonadota bacterium]